MQDCYYHQYPEVNILFDNNTLFSFALINEPVYASLL